MKIYLCGPLEHERQYGGEWRTWITPRLVERDCEVLNPLVKPQNMIPEAKIPQSTYWDSLISAGGETTDEVRAAWRGMQSCIEMCRTMVRECDVVLCHFASPVFTVGTIEELLLAKSLNKQVRFVCTPGYRNTAVPSFWLLVEFATPENRGEVFLKSFEDFFEQLPSLKEKAGC